MNDQVIKAMNKLLSYNSDDLKLLCVHVSEGGKTTAHRKPLIKAVKQAGKGSDNQDHENG